jgi:anti-sigma factor RsiW
MNYDLMLERYRLGELSGAERAELERALAADAALKARLDALGADSRATLERLTPRAVAAEVERRLAKQQERPPARSLVPALALSFALVLVIAAGLLLSNSPDDIVLKGERDPALRVFRQTVGAPERLFDGAKVRARDRVQVAFDLAGERALVVVSIDGAGRATLHFPADGNSVAPANLRALPEAFELDDAPGFERFFLVTSINALDARAVLEAAQRLAARPDARTASLTVPTGSTQRSLLLEKVP